MESKAAEQMPDFLDEIGDVVEVVRFEREGLGNGISSLQDVAHDEPMKPRFEHSEAAGIPAIISRSPGLATFATSAPTEPKAKTIAATTPAKWIMFRSSDMLPQSRQSSPASGHKSARSLRSRERM